VLRSMYLSRKGNPAGAARQMQEAAVETRALPDSTSALRTAAEAVLDPSQSGDKRMLNFVRFYNAVFEGGPPPPGP
jgi:hypothetical protein